MLNLDKKEIYKIFWTKVSIKERCEIIKNISYIIDNHPSYYQDLKFVKDFLKYIRGVYPINQK